MLNFKALTLATAIGALALGAIGGAAQAQEKGDRKSVV